MEDPEFVLACRCAGRDEASVCQVLLAEEGIQARLLESTSPFAGLGSLSAEATEVWVPRAVAERARRIIEERRRSAPTEKAERGEDERPCPGCGERNPVAFNVCWNCQVELPAGWTATDSVVDQAADSSQEQHGMQEDDLSKRRRAELVPRSTLDRRTLKLELLLVLLILFVAPLLGRIVEVVESVEFLPATPLWLLRNVAWDLAWIGLILYLVCRDGGSLGMLGLRGEVWWRELLYGAGILVIVGLVQVLVWMLTSPLDLPTWASNTPEPSSSTATWFVLPVFLLSGAFFEEVFFRAYLWTRLVQLTARPGLALVASSALFAAAHVSPPALALGHAAFGLVLGAVFWAYRRLPRLVVVHWASNLGYYLLA